MPDSERRTEPESGPTAWVLAAPGAGDNAQLRTLVELLDADARWIDQVDPVVRVLWDRLTGFRASRIPRPKADICRPPWPDLVLIAGGRSVVDARRIRHASGGRARVVCLGRPWAPLHWFDLVVTTPQYRLPAAENVLMLDLPLNLPPRVPDDVLARWRDEFQDLPRPLVGVLLGGDSGSYRFDPDRAGGLADSVNKILRKGGSAVVVGSPRTPQDAIEALSRRLAVPARCFSWRSEGPNPYASVLKLADALLVSGDSASMLAEACHSGKPVGLLELRERARSRFNRKLRSATPVLTDVTAKLVVRGLWIPARDMPELHRRAEGAGLLTDLGALPSGTGRTDELNQATAQVRQRVFALLGQ